MEQLSGQVKPQIDQILSKQSSEGMLDYSLITRDMQNLRENLYKYSLANSQSTSVDGMLRDLAGSGL